MSDRIVFRDLCDFIGGLTPEEQLALSSNPQRLKDLAHSLVAASAIDEVFIRSLDYTKVSIIAELVKKGVYLGYCNQEITDANYPVTGKGVVQVSYRILKGSDVKREDDEYVSAEEVDTAFALEGMRYCNPAEGLLVPAEDMRIGLYEHHPLVIPMDGSNTSFYVVGDGKRRGLYRNADRKNWRYYANFLGVCK